LNRGAGEFYVFVQAEAGGGFDDGSGVARQDEYASRRGRACFVVSPKHLGRRGWRVGERDTLIRALLGRLSWARS
jgi:hypothetical protein